MQAIFIPFTIFTIFFGFTGITLPFFFRKSPNRGVIQCVLILGSAACYLFWLLSWFAQIHPLIGPKLHKQTVLIMAREWGNPIHEEI